MPGMPGKTAEVNWTRETEQMCLMVDPADIEHETDLLGRELPEPPVLAERSDLDGTAGRAWMQTLRLIDVAANVDAELLQYRLTVRRLEQLLIDGVSSWVLGNRHRYSAELIAEPATAGQRATRRAIELLKGRPPGTPVDLNRTCRPSCHQRPESANRLPQYDRQFAHGLPARCPTRASPPRPDTALSATSNDQPHRPLLGVPARRPIQFGIPAMLRRAPPLTPCAGQGGSRGRPNAESGFPRARRPFPTSRTYRNASRAVRIGVAYPNPHDRQYRPRSSASYAKTRFHRSVT
jgi:hypothetical protein